MISTIARRAACAVTLAALLLSHPLPALAEELWDDPTYEPDVLSFGQKAEMYAEMGPLSNDISAPYKYLYTPTHYQKRSYWCGPATCQVIDDYFGSWTTQETYAWFMGTTTNGTVFSRLDDCLRHYTGKPYYYHGSIPNRTEVYNQVGRSIGDRYRPAAALVRIYASSWPRYEYSHSGHIVPIEAFDYRSAYQLFRLNDPYDERDWRTGGGATGGRKTYWKVTVADAVLYHPQKALVW